MTYFFLNIFLACDSTRRQQIVDILNSQFENVLKEKLTIFQSYAHMVAQNPYRVLASYSYDWEETPLRSQRVAPVPALTEAGSDSSSDNSGVCLPSIFKNLTNIKDHDEYVQKLLNARTLAQVNDAPTRVTWRGYTSVVTPTFEISRDNLTKSIINALQRMPKITQLERQVIIHSIGSYNIYACVPILYFSDLEGRKLIFF